MKLHELLAVEGNHETQANKCRGELAETFQKKRHHFEEKKVTFISNAEGAQATVESQSDIQTSVKKELDWISSFITKSLDASFQVAAANTHAKADIILEDDTVLATDVPATSLLELEKRVTEVMQLIAVIPTLDPAKGFSPDSQRGDGIYQARQVNKKRTAKTSKVITLAEPTKEHPAQVQLVQVDVDVGTIQEQEWSSLISPAQKADLLSRCEILGRAVRRARSRANEATVDTTKKIGAKLLDYVFKGAK